jgi:hypothetical protein
MSTSDNEKKSFLKERSLEFEFLVLKLWKYIFKDREYKNINNFFYVIFISFKMVLA